MDDGTDYYAVLGLTQAASKQEVKQAFRLLSRTCHPDKGGQSGDFHDIRAAYEVLVDDEARAEYDEQFTCEDDTLSSLATTVVHVPPHLLYRQSRHTVRYERGGQAEVRDIHVPAGTVDFTRLVIGDDDDQLVVLVRHRKMRGVAVIGKDVVIDTTITLRDALCGGGLNISRPDGARVRVTLPRGAVIAPGSIWAVAGQGLPDSRGDGVLYARVHILFPSRLAEDGMSAAAAAAWLGCRTPPTAAAHTASANRACEADIASAKAADKSIIGSALETAGIDCPVQ